MTMVAVLKTPLSCGDSLHRSWWLHSCSAIRRDSDGYNDVSKAQESAIEVEALTAVTSLFVDPKFVCEVIADLKRTKVAQMQKDVKRRRKDLSEDERRLEDEEFLLAGMDAALASEAIDESVRMDLFRIKPEA